MPRNLNERTKEELLEEFSNQPSHNTLAGEQYTVAIIAKSADEVNKGAERISVSVDNFKSAVEKMGVSSDNLGTKLFWLNVILVIATVAGTIITLVALFKK